MASRSSKTKTIDRSTLSARMGRLRAVHTTPYCLTKPFAEFASPFAAEPNTVVLLSGGKLDCARYHLLAMRPWLVLRGRGRDLTLTVNGRCYYLKEDPFEVLRLLLDTYRLDPPPYGSSLPHGPLKAGLLGYLAYDLKDCIEDLPRTAIDDLGLPHIYLVAPSLLLIHDRHRRSSWLHGIRHSGDRDFSMDVLYDFIDARQSARKPKDETFSGSASGFQSPFDPGQYRQAVRTIKDYIVNGDVYQVNMSQRFRMPFYGSGYALCRALYRDNPAPFFAYLNADDHQIVSTSPERFIQRRGDHLETRPIKGTRPRGQTGAEDLNNRQALATSAKDAAELSMIVDLLRNDFGRVCRAGTVKVKDHKRLEAYTNVYHLVSVIEGQRDRQYDSVDIVRATFPGGSITGCPKIRSMEIIDELEPVRRHVYTGSIGYFGFDDTMDLSIAIRTATIFNDMIQFSVGGGIVYDSDPALEYQETLHKGQSLMAVFKGTGVGQQKDSVVWQNGLLKPFSEAGLALSDEAIHYGFGFFETLRVDHGAPCMLAEHIERFNCAWRELFGSLPPDLTWATIIDQVIKGNALQKQVASVKIMATRGHRTRPPFDHSLIVIAKPYTHRLAGHKEAGLYLLTYTHRRHCHLAEWKTLNYLFYLRAGRWARAQGADEALILNGDGTVSETNSGSLLVVRDNQVWLPESAHALPGTMQAAASACMVDWGYQVQRRAVLPEDLMTADQVLVTNSLMGAVAVLDLDGRALPQKPAILKRLSAAL